MTGLEPGSRIAVTGANGFIGAHCVVSLLEAGFQVIAIVRDPANEDKTAFLKEEAAKLKKEDQLSFEAGDLFEEGSYDKAFEGCRGVIHTAAVVDVSAPGVEEAEAKIVRPSVQGTANVLQSIKKNLDTIQRYVHISSVAAIQSLDKPEDYVFKDSDWNTWSTVEKDAYGYAKTKAEKLVWDDQDLSSSNVETVVLNPVIVLGPCLCKAHTKSSTFFIREIIYGNPILNYNGSFVDVRDVAQGAVLAFSSSKEVVENKRFILCATDQPFSTIKLNDIVKKVHPWVKGSQPKLSPWMIQSLIVVGQIPFLQPYGINEFQKEMMQRLVTFDSTQSKDILGVKYKSLEDTCRDSVDSMRPFVTVKNWGGEEKK